MNIGFHELHEKKYRRLEYWEYPTWFFWKRWKLCANGHAVDRSRFSLTSLVIKLQLCCVSNILVTEFQISGSWMNFYGNIGKVMLSLVWIILSLELIWNGNKVLRVMYWAIVGFSIVWHSVHDPTLCAISAPRRPKCKDYSWSWDGQVYW